jgi:hypothetical protein
MCKALQLTYNDFHQNQHIMIKTQSKDGTERILILNETFLLIDKEDTIFIEIKNDELKFNLQFSYCSDGDPLSTTYWESLEENSLHYRLNNWDYNTWVEISKPVLLKVKDSSNNYWMRFRNDSQSGKNMRKFEVSIWKEVNHG